MSRISTCHWARSGLAAAVLALFAGAALLQDGSAAEIARELWEGARAMFA